MAKIPEESSVSNQNIQSALAYHEATKLTYINLRNKPPLYKAYPGLPVIALPSDFAQLETSTLDAVSGPGGPEGGTLDLATLARLLSFSAGVIRKAVHPSAGEIHYRAAASAGALYPTETYLVCRNIPGLAAGVYHFSPEEFGLHQLRQGDYRAELARAAGAEESPEIPIATLVFTSIFWRSAWKYRARGCRYCFWDNGTIVANLLAAARASGLPARLVAGFVDQIVDRLVGADGEREASTCLVAIGRDSEPAPSSNPLLLEPLSNGGLAPSEGEIDYPEIRQSHAASLLTTKEAVAAWQGNMEAQLLPIRGTFHPLQPEADPAAASETLGHTIGRRGSTRRFARSAIPFGKFSVILDRVTNGVPADFLGPGGTSLLDMYMVVNSVTGLPPGAYFYSPQQRGLELLKAGDFREESGHLGFEQALSADASAVFFFMADLGAILERFGNRGYRAVQLEAGILGGRVYLCAQSLGLGASGLTFYDDDVTDFFSPHAAGKSTIFVLPLGVTDQVNRVRPFRSAVAVALDALARGAGKTAP